MKKPVKILEIPLFTFSQLSKEAKQKAIDKYYESEDYPFMEDDMKEILKATLDKMKVKYEEVKPLYSLSYSQGDGFCFTGKISKDGITLKLTHSYRYYFAKSVDMSFVDKDGEEIDEEKEVEKVKKLQDIYFSVCKTLEKHGYAILEYRMNFEEMAELCEANEYTFEADGSMNNR